MSNHKRQRAMISQAEPDFNRQAAEAEMDLVAVEQEELGSDRNTVGIRTKMSPFPKSFGAYKGDAQDTTKALNSLINYLTPKVHWKLHENDFNMNQSTVGGYQMAWDSVQYLSRSSTVGATLGDDTWTTLASPSMEIISMKNLRRLYNKMINDVTPFQTATTAVTHSSALENQLPGLTITGFSTSKMFTNTGLNQIVIELWDCLCVQDTSKSPMIAWSLDQNSGYGPNGTFLNINGFPNNIEATRSWGNPGNRPNKRWDKMFHSMWRPLRKTRYILRPGQSISHTITLPSTTITHDQLYPPDKAAGVTTVAGELYQRNISMECIGFALGELCFDSRAAGVGVEKMSTSSVFLQGRSIWEFNTRTSIKARGNFSFETTYDLGTDLADRTVLYPQIPLANQRIIGQNGVPGVFVNANQDA